MPADGSAPAPSHSTSLAFLGTWKTLQLLHTLPWDFVSQLLLGDSGIRAWVGIPAEEVVVRDVGSEVEPVALEAQLTFGKH